MNIELAECKRCGREIMCSDTAPSWVHTRTESLIYNRGCRASSYVEGQGWNDSLDRKWYASPQPGTIRMETVDGTALLSHLFPN